MLFLYEESGGSIEGGRLLRSGRSRDSFWRETVLLGAASRVFFEPLRRIVPVIVYHITLIHMVIARGAVTTRLRRKLSEQCEGQCEGCVGGSGEGVMHGGCRGSAEERTPSVAEGMEQRQGERRVEALEMVELDENGANAILNSPLATCLLSTMSDRWTGSHLLAL